MHIRVHFLIILLMICSGTYLFSQTVVNPNYGLKSHETLEISKIEISAAKTVIYLTIENRIDKGSFCADKNIYLVEPGGSRVKLQKATGIPVCPQSFEFKSVGEKLNFTLTFPPLTGEFAYIDIIEQCSDNCFSFYGVVLDDYLNSRLDEGFSMAERGESLKAMNKFIILAEEKDKSNSIRALIWFNIVKLATETGNTVKAAEWYKKLSSPGVPGARVYVEQLNAQGIKY